MNLLSSSGYYGIFLFLLSGVFGPPIPDEILLMMIGYCSCGGPLEFFPSLAWVLTGSLGGSVVNYLVGRCCFFSAKLIKMQRSPRLAAKVLSAQNLVKRFGPAIVAGAYFLPGLRHWALVVAGTLKVPPARLGFWACLGALLWSAAYLGLGYFLAKNGVTPPDYFDLWFYLAIPGAALISLALWLSRRTSAGEKSAEISPRT